MTRTTQATIQHMTLRWAGPPSEARAPATALRVENLLNQANWQPRTMRPGEILLIRRLCLPSDVRTLRTPVWDTRLTDALTQVLDDAYRTAARPVAGQWLPQANAIVFEDAAVLLMSLTREVLSAGSSAPAWAAQRWYWPQVMAGERADTASALLGALWSRYAAHVPAALAHLSPQQAHHACCLLDPTDALRVWRALATAYALALPQSLVELTHPPASSHAPTHAGAPWARWLTNGRLVEATISKTTELLLGMCAMLRRTPAHARSATFAAQVAAWWHGQPSTTIARDPQIAQEVDAITAHHSVSPQADKEWPQPVILSKRAEPQLQTHSRSLAATASAGNHDGPLNTATIVERDDAASQPHRTQQTTPLISDLPDQIRGRLGDEMTHAALEVDEPAEARDAPLPTRLDGVRTRLGGVFFLVNVLRHVLGHLKLPDALDEAVNGWDVITALAWRLLHSLSTTDDYDDCNDDPIWDLLARLAEHPIDAQVPADLSEVLDHGLALVRQLLADDASTSADAAIMLLCKPGLVTLSHTHLDVYFPLSAADLRLRRVGLDGDPGWVPDLGYIIQFHFDEAAGPH